jgi:hypothetical protein
MQIVRIFQNGGTLMKNCHIVGVRMIARFLIILGCSIAFCGCSLDGTPKVNTEYQAVFLNNGQVFFGKLENAGSKYPLLKDVFYIQSNQDPVTKQVNSVITKRGSELHGPDMMYINAKHILIIESVTSGSKVAQLIQESKTKK